MGWKSVVVCVVAGLTVIYFVPPSSYAVSTTAKVNPQAGPSFSQDVVEMAVRPLLRDPQSAVFSDLSMTTDRKLGPSPAGKVICGYVNAKNGFGGFTGNKAFFNFYGTRVSEIEPTPETKHFASMWNKLCAG